MDIFQMLDLAEELLNLYGYEVHRNIGVVGGDITTAELGQDPIYVPKKTSKGIVHRLDLLGEKTDIERPFGRIAVMYKRGSEKVTPADIYNLGQVMQEIEAYYGMFLTNTGIADEADTAAKNNRVEIITEERLEKLIGKASVEQPWWQGYPAFEPQIDYKQSLYYFKYYFEKMLHLSWPVLFIFKHEFTWTPYWKFTYYIDTHKGKRPTKMDEYQGFSGINAFTGNMDFVLFSSPSSAKLLNTPQYVMQHELVNRTFRDFKSKLGKVHKPAWLPKHVSFNVLKPALQKHEVKLAAQQYISKWFNVPPEEVVITGRELIYMPMWRLMIFNRPLVKNIHIDTEHFPCYVSAVDGEGVNYWHLAGDVQPLAEGWGRGAKKGKYIESGSNMFRPFIYRYMEWILYTLFGVVNYTNLMRRLTWGTVRLFWSFNVRVQRWMVKASWLGIQAFLWLLLGTLFPIPFQQIFAFLVSNVLLLPLHALLYIWHDALRLYPHKTYPHPDLSKKDIEHMNKKTRKYRAAATAYDSLLTQEKEGKLSDRQKRDLKKLKERRVEGLFKRIKD